MDNINGNTRSISESDRSIMPWHITLSAIGACLSLILLAVEVTAGEGAAKPSNLERLASELALTDEQVHAVDRILTEAMANRQRARESFDNGSREALRAELKSITERADGQLREVLSDDQFSNYIALRTQLRREALRRRVRDARWNN